MSALPILDVWVTDGCRSCVRTLKTLFGCNELQSLVTVQVRNLGEPGEVPPPAVIGGPAIVFRGTVIALGTPECSTLVERILGLMQVTASGGGT